MRKRLLYAVALWSQRQRYIGTAVLTFLILGVGFCYMKKSIERMCTLRDEVNDLKHNKKMLKANTNDGIQKSYSVEGMDSAVILEKFHQMGLSISSYTTSEHPKNWIAITCSGTYNALCTFLESFTNKKQYWLSDIIVKRRDTTILDIKLHLAGFHDR